MLVRGQAGSAQRPLETWSPLRANGQGVQMAIARAERHGHARGWQTADGDQERVRQPHERPLRTWMYIRSLWVLMESAFSPPTRRRPPSHQQGAESRSMLGPQNRRGKTNRPPTCIASHPRANSTDVMARTEEQGIRQRIACQMVDGLL